MPAQASMAEFHGVGPTEIPTPHACGVMALNGPPDGRGRSMESVSEVIFERVRVRMTAELECAKKKGAENRCQYVR